MVRGALARDAGLDEDATGGVLYGDVLATKGYHVERYECPAAAKARDLQRRIRDLNSSISA